MGAYNVVDGLGVLGEDVVKDLLEVVLLGGKVIIADFDLIDEALGDDLAPPVAEVDWLGGKCRTLVVSSTCLL